ncbi:MAG TPA: crosslink repair DNA glycosylase YcaQ family protein [Amycolatopsis sp.]|uniref:Crosslink repair DNA glycosylase YcaQ family protein n=1 Tax=Amycolatopsis nalaikhensis TaxID=715472 RepID=A0ABY8XRU9_9PSEU|nr:crosslink repair DNA glycosylase YcaQ family protein [Amycolatopsis sp. 2-2]WIV58364.1 crosslink repair DNA glycosylase YcaQ family protein [Amycolatopsis sp. 2-2]
MDRRQVLAYRIAEHGLHRSAADVADLAVVRAGLQDSMRDTALLALVARLDGEVSLDDDRLVLAWTLRGAPHYHLRADLPEAIRALIPLDDADALARMLWQRKEVAVTGKGASEVVFTAAAALRAVVTEPMTKGAASTAVTKKVPDSFSRWCRGCNATHIHEQLMRIAAPLGGVRLVAGASPATLAPLEGRGRLRKSPDPAAATAVVERYLRLNGPASPGDAAEFAGTARAVVDRTWPADLAEVKVDGKVRYLPSDRLAALENPPEPEVVRLLPPWDPFIQARDKALLVPDPARRKEVWKMLGNPGVLIADGDIAGTWRTKSSGAKLAFTMTVFDPLRPAVREEAEAEAARVAAARGFGKHTVTWVG